MTKEKQIEEMANDFDTVMQSRCFHKSCNECEFDRYDTCKATMLADALINDYGYRKASEVAEEIVTKAITIVGKIITEHIESDNSLIETEVDIIHALTDLEKKYTEGEG